MREIYKALKESPRYWDKTHGPFTEGHCRHTLGKGFNYIRDIDGDYYEGRPYLVFQGELSPSEWLEVYTECSHCGRKLQEIDFRALTREDLEFFSDDRIKERYEDLRSRFGWNNASKGFKFLVDEGYLKRIKHGFAVDQVGREW